MHYRTLACFGVNCKEEKLEELELLTGNIAQLVSCAGMLRGASGESFQIFIRRDSCCVRKSAGSFKRMRLAVHHVIVK